MVHLALEPTAEPELQIYLMHYQLHGPGSFLADPEYQSYEPTFHPRHQRFGIGTRTGQIENICCMGSTPRR